jgi:hypothetical protein
MTLSLRKGVEANLDAQFIRGWSPTEAQNLLPDAEVQVGIITERWMIRGELPQRHPCLLQNLNSVRFEGGSIFQSRIGGDGVIHIETVEQGLGNGGERGIKQRFEMMLNDDEEEEWSTVDSERNTSEPGDPFCCSIHPDDLEEITIERTDLNLQKGLLNISDERNGLGTESEEDVHDVP